MTIWRIILSTNTTFRAYITFYLSPDSPFLMWGWCSLSTFSPNSLPQSFIHNLQRSLDRGPSVVGQVLPVWTVSGKAIPALPVWLNVSGTERLALFLLEHNLTSYLFPIAASPLAVAEVSPMAQTTKKRFYHEDFLPWERCHSNAGMNKLWKAFTTEQDIIIIHV